MHASKTDANFWSRLGRWSLPTRCPGLCFMIIRDIPVLALATGIYQLYPKSVLVTAFVANTVSICWDRPGGI